MDSRVGELEAELARLKRRYDRERKARLEAEAIGEESTHKLYGTVRDVVQELNRSNRELEEAYKERERANLYLKNLIESSTDAIIATDRDRKMVFFNEGAG